MSDFLVFGTILYDHINDNYYIGGCHTNVAIHAARLGFNTSMISSVGQDKIGFDAIRQLAANGINTEGIVIDIEHPTGTVEVDISAPENPIYIVPEGVAYDYIILSEAQKKFLAEGKFDYFYFGTYEQKYEINRETLRWIFQNVKIRRKFLDINLREGRYTDEIIRESLKIADILKVNEEEFVYLQKILMESGEWNTDGITEDKEKDFAEFLIQYYSIETLVITKSNKGATAYQKEQKVSVPAVPVQVIDSVGAGDAFAAAFLYWLDKTDDLKAALTAGTVLGSFVAGQRSAVPEYTKEQILTLVK